MGLPAEYTLLITDPAGDEVVADPIHVGNPRTGQPGWSEIRLGPRLNEVGSGTFTCSARPDLLAAANGPDNRVIVLRDDPAGGSSIVAMAGPIERPKHPYEAVRDGIDGPGLLTVTFADDLELLTDRLVYPDPAQPATNQITVTRYTITAQNPEDAARALVTLNAGPTALVDRRTPGLVLGADNGILPGVTISTSFTRDAVLTDALREVARLAGVAAGTTPRVPRFRIVQGAGQLQFVVTMPADLSGSVVFSRELGNIAALEYEPEAPTATVAIVGDATAGVGRIVKERSNADAHTAGWRRREVWVDARGAANATELEQAGDSALDEGRPKTRYQLTAIDTPATRYGYDFHIGDLVGTEPYAGAFVPAVVFGADITVTPTRGEETKPIIGVEGDQIGDRKTEEIRRLQRRMAALEGAL
jgi:hypothetical protein